MLLFGWSPLGRQLPNFLQVKSLNMGKIVRLTGFLSLGTPTSVGVGKLWNQTNCHHHHHHVVPLARISLTLSRHFSLSFIASGRSSGLHPVSSHSCWMYVRVGRPAFARPYVGVHRSTSLMSSSLLLQQCPACLVRLTWIVFVMGGNWPCIASSSLQFSWVNTYFSSGCLRSLS